MTAPAEGAPRKPFGLRFTAPLLLGSTLNPINSALIATALVGIGTDFHLGTGATTTLISVLYLCSAVAQPTMGKLSTVFGPRRVFLAGVGILFLAGLIGVLAPSFGVLLLSRALIGIGTSAAYPTAMALVRRRADSLGTGVPSRVLGNFSIAAQVTAVIGLPLGGVLIAAFGWRSLFFINMPLALISILLTFFGVAKDAPQSGEERGSIVAALDIPGILLFAGTVTSLILFLADLRAPSGGSPCCLWRSPPGCSSGNDARCGRSSTSGCWAATVRCSAPTCARCSSPSATIRRSTASASGWSRAKASTPEPSASS